MPLDFNEIRQLLATIAQTDIAELTLKSDDFELVVRKAVSAHHPIAAPVAAVGLPSSAAALPQVVSPGVAEGAAVHEVDTAVSRAVQPPVAAPSPQDQRLVDVTSPMVGTFYRAPAPGEAPFVEVGDRIRTNQTVCIIEAMKLMNEIEAEVSGQVVEILVQNGEPVEFGQSLMRVRPD